MTSLGGLKVEGNLLPPPAMALDVFHFTEGDVVVITVFPSAYPPIRYQGQVWIRVGARKALATDEDIHILEERRLRNGRRFEEQPCTRAKIEDMDLELFRNQYLPKAIQSEVIEEDSRSVQEQMAALSFYDLDANVPTNLGIMLFGKHPERFIPSAYLQYVKFSSQDNSGEILAEHAYRGPFLRIISELDSLVKVGISSPHPVRISPLQERTAYIYPYWSMRELLMNSIIHRDYEISNSPIKFYDYNGTRIEITNPGGLFGLANIDNFPTVNDYRNPRLSEAIKVMGYVNKFNLGISKVKEELEQNGNPPPVFEILQRTQFRVIVRPAVEVYDDAGILVQNNSEREPSSEQSQVSGELSGETAIGNREVTPSNQSHSGKPNQTTDTVNALVTAKEKPVGDTVGDTVKRLLVVLSKVEEMGIQELLSRLNLHHKVNLLERYLRPAIELKMIERTQPNSLHSPTQKYRLTAKGHVYLEGLKDE